MRYADPLRCRFPHRRVTSDAMADITIREATSADWPGIWELFRGVAAAGDVFTYDEHTPEDVARKLWFDPPAACFVAEIDGRLAGTYYVRPNHPGRGSHVANGGYMVSP